MSLKEIKPFGQDHLGWLAATFESVFDYVFIADLEDRFMYINPAALKKLGYKKEEMLGETAEMIMSKNNPKELRPNMLKATLEFPFSWEGEVINVAKDGQEFVAHLRTALVRNKRGEPIGMTGFSRDITERKHEQEKLEEYAQKLEKANQDLRDMQEQLLRSEKLAAIGVLAAGLAHEIGNPLASISSVVQLLKRKYNDSVFNQSVASIQMHIGRISQIIQNVSDFTKREEPYLVMAVELEPIVRAVLQKLCLKYNDKKVEIKTKISPTLPRVQGEASQLAQALTNILTNSYEGIINAGEVSVVAQKGVKNLVKISISDTGQGISKENIQKVFEPFFTTKEVGNGTGLGLSVSYGIIKSFGGDIRIESMEGQGTVVDVFLPIYRGGNNG